MEADGGQQRLVGQRRVLLPGLLFRQPLLPLRDVACGDADLVLRDLDLFEQGTFLGEGPPFFLRAPFVLFDLRLRGRDALLARRLARIEVGQLEARQAGMPVRIPGPTTRGERPKSLVDTRSQIGSSGGTTLEIAMSVTSSHSRSACRNSARSVRTVSSDVCSRWVPMRQCSERTAAPLAG